MILAMAWVNGGLAASPRISAHPTRSTHGSAGTIRSHPNHLQTHAAQAEMFAPDPSWPARTHTSCSATSGDAGHRGAQHQPTPAATRNAHKRAGPLSASLVSSGGSSSDSDVFDRDGAAHAAIHSASGLEAGGLAAGAQRSGGHATGNSHAAGSSQDAGGDSAAIGEQATAAEAVSPEEGQRRLKRAADLLRMVHIMAPSDPASFNRALILW